LFYRYKEHVPKVHQSAFVAESAAVIGNVTIGKESSVWFNATLRGDEEKITIGNRTSIQENVVCHVFAGFSLTIGDEVTIGHGAVVHGCTIKDRALIGIGATILDGAVIGENSIIGAHTLIPEGEKIPANSLVLGSPGKVVRKITDGDRELLKLSVDTYAKNAKDYQDKKIFEKISEHDVIF